MHSTGEACTRSLRNRLTDFCGRINRTGKRVWDHTADATSPQLTVLFIIPFQHHSLPGHDSMAWNTRPSMKDSGKRIMQRLQRALDKWWESVGCVGDRRSTIVELISSTTSKSAVHFIRTMSASQSDQDDRMHRSSAAIQSGRSVAEIRQLKYDTTQSRHLRISSAIIHCIESSHTKCNHRNVIDTNQMRDDSQKLSQAITKPRVKTCTYLTCSKVMINKVNICRIIQHSKPIIHSIVR